MSLHHHPTATIQALALYPEHNGPQSADRLEFTVYPHNGVVGEPKRGMTSLADTHMPEYPLGAEVLNRGSVRIVHEEHLARVH